MTEPIRSPKDEGNQPIKQTLPIQGGHGQDYKDGWLERIFRLLEKWKSEKQDADAIDRLLVELKSMFDWVKSQSGLATKQDLIKLKEEIMATQAEIVAQLNAVLAQTKKTNTEIQRVNSQLATLQAASDALTAKVAELQALIDAGGTIGPELVQVAADLTVAAQANDDAIPDEIVVPPTP